jgi:ribosomal protein L7Ae-like RNA K-turn-binding protein
MATALLTEFLMPVDSPVTPLRAALETTHEHGTTDVTTPRWRVVLHQLLYTATHHGYLARGVNEAAKALARDEAQLCVLASTCDDPEYIQLISDLCSDRDIPLFTDVDGATLGEWAGLSKFTPAGKLVKSVGCSCVVVGSLLDTAHPLSLARPPARGQWG